MLFDVEVGLKVQMEPSSRGLLPAFLQQVSSELDLDSISASCKSQHFFTFLPSMRLRDF